MWFGRDYFGRGSLLKNASTDAFILTSVGHTTFGKVGVSCLFDVEEYCLFFVDADESISNFVLFC